MKVKRFTAQSIPAAISLVRSEFGSNAIILHTRKVRKRGIFGWFRPASYEVVAAADIPNAEVQERHNTVSAPGVDLSKLEAELAEIKSSLRGKHTTESPDFPPILKEAQKYLIEQDIEPILAEQLILGIKLKAEAENLPIDADWVKRELYHSIVRSMRCVDPSSIGETSRIIPLIGPTGVGKTTTIAKLTANFALLGNKKVGIVTTDTYRIAAVDQLKTYADLIGVPIEVVYSPEEMKEAIELFHDKDLILVDTAGRSHKHALQMRELKAFLDVLDSPETHLVVSATTRSKDLLDIANRFGVVTFNNIIVSKIDETVAYGCIYNLGYLTGKTITYLTNGQNVPDDIEVAEPSRIADLIMGGILHGPG